MQEYFRNRKPITDIEISPYTALLLVIIIALIIAFVSSFFSNSDTDDDDFDPNLF